MIGDEPSNTEPDPAASEEAVPRGEGGTGMRLPRESGGESCREPDAGNPHVLFDERGWETGRRPSRYRAYPRLY